MKSHRSLLSCLLVLVAVPSFASAAEAPLAEWLKKRVQSGLIEPLARSENDSFSRMRPPPRERRVRSLATTAKIDEKGHAFVPFVVDVRFGDEWKEDIVGCAYRKSGELFVKKGDVFYPAALLLRKKVSGVPGACVEAQARS